MNTQNCSTLQLFQSFSHKCKSLFLQSCPKELIRFLLRMHNKSAQRKPAKHRMTSPGKLSEPGSSIVSNIQLGSKGETCWRPIEAYSSLKLLLLPSLTICPDMEQFVLVPASVYNKSLITQLQSRNFQNINLLKILPTKLIHLRRR